MKKNTKRIDKKRRNDAEVRRRLGSIRSDQPLWREDHTLAGQWLTCELASPMEHAVMGVDKHAAAQRAAEEEEPRTEAPPTRGSQAEGVIGWFVPFMGISSIWVE